MIVNVKSVRLENEVRVRGGLVESCSSPQVPGDWLHLVGFTWLLLTVANWLRPPSIQSTRQGPLYLHRLVSRNVNFFYIDFDKISSFLR